MKKDKTIMLLILSSVLLTGCQSLEHIHKWSMYYDNNDGTHTRMCLNDSRHRETEPHDFSIIEIEKDATDIMPGRRRLTCSKCSYSKTESILPKGDHVFNKEIVAEQYLYENCSDYCKIYYKSCECGAYGNPDYLFENSLLPEGYSNIEYIQGHGAQYIDTEVKKNSNNKVEYNMCKHSQGRLPNEYQEVEYIESTGTQCIDTTYIVNKNDGARLVLDYQPSNNEKEWQGANWYLQFSNEYLSDESRHYIEITNDNGLESIYSNGKLLLTNDFTGSDKANIKIALLGLGDIDNTWYQGNYARGKLYGAEYYLNSFLVARYVPAYKKADGKIGLYDVVNNCFLLNAGTGTFLKGKDVSPKMRLPNEYQEVEYIESEAKSGAYINTRIIPNQDMSISCEFEVSGFADSESVIFGAANENYYDNSFEMYTWNDSIHYNYAGQHVELQQNGKHIAFESNKNTYNFFGGINTSGSFDYKIASPNNDLTLFALHRNGGVLTAEGSTKIYSFQLFDENKNLLLDLVPCYLKDTYQPGMYDLINYVFLTNDGTGKFVLGKEIYEYNDNNSMSLPCLNNSTNKSLTNSNQFIELEFLESTGSQFINTQVSVKPNTRSYLDLKVESISNTANDWSELYGYSKNTTGVPYSLWGSKKDNCLYFYNNEGKQQIPLPNERTTLNLVSNATDISGSIYVFSLGPNTGTYVNALNPCKLFALQIYEGDTLVRDFVPSRRNSDGELGLLDKLNNKFYENEGTGTFIGGPEKELSENILIGYKYNGHDATYYYGRIYDAVVYENDKIIQKYIPCLRNSDSAIGMYDLINNRFVKTSSQTDFNHSPVIGHKLDNGVIAKEATHDEEGVKVYTCSTCGEQIYEMIPKLSFKVSFDCDDGVKEIRIYSNANSDEYEISSVGYSRNLFTNNYSKTNSGVYFEIIFKDDYVLDKLEYDITKAIYTDKQAHKLICMLTNDINVRIFSKKIV